MDHVVVVDSSSASDELVSVVVSLTTFGGDLVGRWEVQAVGAVARLIPVGEQVALNYHDSDHPLLLPYAADRAHVSFTGKPNVPKAQVIGSLYSAHAAVVGDHIPLGQYMNSGYSGDPPDRGIAELLDGGYGTLAHGPLPLVRAYADVLAEFGVRVAISEARQPMRGARHGEWEFGWYPSARWACCCSCDRRTKAERTKHLARSSHASSPPHASEVALGTVRVAAATGETTPR